MENAQVKMRLSFMKIELLSPGGIQDYGVLLSSLSEDAKQLLTAAKQSDGRVLYVKYMGGAVIQAAKKNFIEPNNDREEARWKAALDELCRHLLIDDLGDKGDVFRMTKRGHDVVKEIEGKVKQRAEIESPDAPASA
jgi:hypothetical protein